MIADLERVLYRESTLLARLDEMAEEIARDYAGRDLAVVAVMNGSLMFMADLLRRIPLPLRLDCVSVASYHGGTRATGEVEFNQNRLPDVAGRHVLVLDDILDSGITLDAIGRRLRAGGEPASLEYCVLLRKLRPRERHVEVRYVGFDIADEFVVGYGLDYRERYRNLPLIGVLRRGVIEGHSAAP